MIDLCPLCSSNNKIKIYHEDNVPLFQNKIYATEIEADLVEKGSINLYLCRNCGFVWNGSFDSEKLNYDSGYQNEQANSMVFMEHLASVKQIIEEKNSKNSHIIEIGCGKGIFLNFLQNSGYYKLTGFDPAYEGSSPFVHKCYYPTGDNYIQADLFIIRHVLEHVPDPLNFLKSINIANVKNCKIYIEVPDFEWIAKNGAFWDISYEHCNYFSLSVFESIFPSCKIGYLFGDQYLYSIGDFDIHTPKNNNSFDMSEFLSFKEKMELCRYFVSKKSNLALWGAGAKGANFARMIDPYRESIKCIVDINPRKQGRYIAGTGHLIVSPDELQKRNDIDGIIVMNENYLQEIKLMMKFWNGDFFVLDKCLMKV